MIQPKWKTAKNGAQYWAWLYAEPQEEMMYQVTRLTFFKTKNKLTLRASVTANKSYMTPVPIKKEVNCLTFYLRKNKTLEVYKRHTAMASLFNNKKPKFKNISNSFHEELETLVKHMMTVGSNKMHKIFGTDLISQQSYTLFFLNYLEAGLKSLMADNGLTFEVPQDYSHLYRFAAGILEFRFPVLKIMREDWVKYHKTIPLPTVLSSGTKVSFGVNEADVKEYRPKYLLEIHSAMPVLLKELGKCKTLKDVIRRFTGNEGKVSTRLIFQNFFTVSTRILSPNGMKMYNLAGKTKTWEGENPEKIETAYMVFTGSLNFNLLLLSLTMKGLLSTDHLNLVLENYSKATGIFGNVSGASGFACSVGNVLSQSEEIIFQSPRHIAYEHSVEGDQNSVKLYRKSLKKFKKSQKNVLKGLTTFLSKLGDSKKLSSLIVAQDASFFHDTYKQWYVANDKIVLPEKVKSLQELHDFVAKEYRKLSTRDFDLKLMEVDWVKPLDMLEYCDIKTKRHYVIEIAKTSHQLVDWGQKMKNCIGGYGSRVRDGRGKQVLLAVYVDGKMTYNVEIVDKKINQFHGYRNGRGDADDERAFKEVTSLKNAYENDYANDAMDALRYAVADHQNNINAAFAIEPGQLVVQAPQRLDHIEVQVNVNAGEVDWDRWEP